MRTTKVMSISLPEAQYDKAVRLAEFSLGSAKSLEAVLSTHTSERVPNV